MLRRAAGPARRRRRMRRRWPAVRIPIGRRPCILLEQRDGARHVARNACAGAIERSQVGTASGRATLASLLQEREGVRGIARYALTVLVQSSQVNAPIGNATVACLREQDCTSLGVLEDILALEESDAECAA